ncbi:hypothetical protein MPNT_70084 [Candidatus Methylacidithermus pantelleriae]|uniref:Uncharacterized protein n=1 Tax=Candidatus Methylacidithermus pantelleriae TaxID=2744239 RepID=A0A8J2BQV5_9BACT|nr:hypothetical protein MPNT_70084 [Candidatus Methylacidithermus pantelleriae]
MWNSASNVRHCWHGLAGLAPHGTGRTTDLAIFSCHSRTFFGNHALTHLRPYAIALHTNPRVWLGRKRPIRASTRRIKSCLPWVVFQAAQPFSSSSRSPKRAGHPDGDAHLLPLPPTSEFLNGV